MQKSGYKDSEGYSFHFHDNCRTSDREYFMKCYPRVEDIVKLELNCTSCNDKVVTATTIENVYTHPKLGVTQCEKCHDFYHNSGEFTKDVDGYDHFCLWCGQGGIICSCSFCKKSFCQICIVRNFSETIFTAIVEADEWECFACDQDALLRLRAKHWALLNHIKKAEQKISAGALISDANDIKPDISNIQTLVQSSSETPLKNFFKRRQQLTARMRGNRQEFTKPLPLSPSKAQNVVSSLSQSRFTPYNSPSYMESLSEPSLKSSFSFKTSPNQICVSRSRYPQTQEGRIKRNLEQKLIDTLELSQTSINKIRTIAMSLSFKEAATNLELEEQLNRAGVIVELIMEKAQQLKSSITTETKSLTERRSKFDEEDNELLLELKPKVIDLSTGNKNSK